MRAKFRPITPKLLPMKVFTDNFEKAARLMEADVKGAFEDATEKWKTPPVWRGYVRLRGADIYISVGTTNEIFKFVDEGTVAHIIRPRNAKFLHWNTGGEDFFAKEVHHPGTKAQNISKNIQEIWNDGLMQEYFEDALITAVQESGHAI